MVLMRTKYIEVGQEGGYWLLTEDACSVKIYSSKQEKNGEIYETHTVSHMEGGKRVRKGFGNLEEAKGWGQKILTRLTQGEVASKSMTPVDFKDMGLAQAELEGLNVGISTVAKEYRQAVEKLGDKGTINDAVRYFLANANPDLPQKEVGEIITELCEAKKKDGLTVRYQKDLEQRLKKFSKVFPGSITTIRTKDIEKWLRDLNTGPKNRNHYGATVTTLFKFAKRSGYLPEDKATAADNLSRAKNVTGDIKIYTPEELTAMLVRLSQADPSMPAHSKPLRSNPRPSVRRTATRSSCSPLGAV